jgi:hypothetical protein
MDFADIEKIIQVNLMGVVNGVHAANAEGIRDINREHFIAAHSMDTTKEDD